MAPTGRCDDDRQGTSFRELHEASEVEANVATGYHAIEFLLWGQDRTERDPASATVPRQTSISPMHRRQSTAAELTLPPRPGSLVDDLDEMIRRLEGRRRRAQELEDKGRKAACLDPDGPGLLVVPRDGGERIKLGVLLHDPEEEQDCFSDKPTTPTSAMSSASSASWNRRIRRAKARSSRARVSPISPAPRTLTPPKGEWMPRCPRHYRSCSDQIKAESGAMAYDQMLAPGNEEGSKMLLDAADALVAQTRAIEGAVVVLNLKIEVAESKGLAKLDKEKK